MNQLQSRRHQVLEATRLLDSPPERAFDRLAELAARLLRAPVALVTLVDDERQFFKSAVGLRKPWAQRRGTPLSHSFCQHAVHDRAPFVVSDAREHPRVKDNLAIRDLGVIAYAGVPLFAQQEAIGAFCVMDHQPRNWTDADLETLRELAESVVSEIALREALRKAEQQQLALRRNEQVYSAILRHLPNSSVFMVDTDLRFVAADGAVVDEELRRRNLSSLAGQKVADIVPAPNRDEVLDVYKSALAGQSRRREIQRGDRYVELNAVPIYAGDAVEHALVLLYDVTDRRLEAEDLRRTRDLLAREHALLDATLTNIDEGIAVVRNHDRRCLMANGAFTSLFGISAAQLTEMSIEAFIAYVAQLSDDPVDLRRRLSDPYAHKSDDFVLTRPRRTVVRRTWTPIILSGEACTLINWRDVTIERDLLAERERQLFVDALTGIPNRRGAVAALDVEDTRRTRYGIPLCVAMLDVDHFKRVNDDFGHAEGDKVLREVARALASEARKTDTVARWGGEEFLAVLPGPLEGAVTFSERARAAIENFDRPRVGRVTISAGVAEVREGETPESAIARADERLYVSKRSGRNRVTA